MNSTVRKAVVVHSGAYEVVPYTPEHAAGAAALQRIVATPDLDVNTKYLEWKYGRNPYFQWRHFYLALRDHEVVATRTFYGSRWEVGDGTSYVVPCGADTIIHPAHRDRSLITLLTQAAMRDLVAAGYPYVMSLSAVPVTALGLMAMGWKAVDRVGALRREAVPLPALRSAMRHGKSYAKKIVGRREEIGGIAQLLPRDAQGEAAGAARLSRGFARFDAAARRGAGDISIAQTVRAASMARLVEAMGSTGCMRHVRDETYLNWRYENPLSDYRFLYAGNDALEGYLVLRVPRYGRSSEVSIVDWEGTSIDVKKVLLQRALDLGRFQRVSIWSLGMDDECRRLLSEFGFEPLASDGIAKFGFRVLVKSLNEGEKMPWHLGGRPILDPTNWQLRMIYSDLC